VVYVAVPAGGSHRYHIHCSVDTAGSGASSFRLAPAQTTPGPAQTQSVPGGPATVGFDTAPISLAGGGWQDWILTNPVGRTWSLRSCDLYEITEGGPAPASPPAPHAYPPAGTISPIYSRLGNASLALHHAFTIGGTGAAFTPSQQPTLPHDAVLTIDTPAGDHRYRLTFVVRDGDASEYQLDGRTGTARSLGNGQAAVDFDVATDTARPHSWTFTAPSAQTWVLFRCVIA
jgi:hypothetical protein